MPVDLDDVEDRAGLDMENEAQLVLTSEEGNGTG